MAKAAAVIREAKRQIKPATKNPDGTLTHYVALGYGKGQIDLMRFFPSKLLVRPGDTVVWQMRPTSDAPHTVTFFNGQPDPGLVVPVSQSSGPPVLYVNPAALFPSPIPPAAALTRSGMYNSGLMLPVPGTTYSQVIGDMTPGPLPVPVPVARHERHEGHADRAAALRGPFGQAVAAGRVRLTNATEPTGARTPAPQSAPPPLPASPGWRASRCRG